ncbi:MAG: hypothetical protein SW019_13070 [Actinomycetota bacterium]|nr:hypothetical protein [Actinomycetota bacterium]
MRRIVRTALAAAAAAAMFTPALATGAGQVAASPAVASEGPSINPMTQYLRRCDFTKMPYVGPRGVGRVTSVLRTEGGEVVADVAANTLVPNVGYEVKLIQLPQSSASPCNPGDPGVAGVTLFTDGVGTGAVTLRAPVTAGATGAWMSVTRPSPHSQIPAEFYTTDFVLPL